MQRLLNAPQQVTQTATMQAATDGQNMLAYLESHYGYEIDAHREGGWDKGGQDNYADIRYLGGSPLRQGARTSACG